MTAPITPERIAFINGLYWSPQERSLGVHQIIAAALKADAEKNAGDSPSEWDISFWALGFLEQVAISIGDQDFLQRVAYVSKWMYAAHYEQAETLYGEPDKRDRGIHDK